MDKQKLRNILFKRKTIKFTILTLIPIIIILILYANGFIPIGLSAKPPIGTIERIQVKKFIEKNPELSDLPDHDNILFEIFGTDKLISVVLDNYKEILQNEGYTLKYEGSGYILGKNFNYVGYLKGITAVGIIVTSEASEEFGYETVVIYMTGNAFDFKPLLNWYQEKFNTKV
jgi:hypothetical protein